MQTYLNPQKKSLTNHKFQNGKFLTIVIVFIPGQKRLNFVANWFTLLVFIFNRLIAFKDK